MRYVLALGVSIALTQVTLAQQDPDAAAARADVIRSVAARLDDMSDEERTRKLEGRTDRELLIELLTRVERLEKRQDEEKSAKSVDLTGDEFESIIDGLEGATPQTEGRPWFRNVEMWGFGAFGFYATGEAGAHEEGGFHVKQSHIFLDAEVTEDVSLYFEIRAVIMGFDDISSLRTFELYADFKNVCCDDGRFNIRVGRLDIPFGEEYLISDAPDNPLASHSAAFLYGLDEGVQLYGVIEGVGWILSIMDGHVRRSIDDDWDKAIVAKVYGEPAEWLYLSGSVMRTGKTASSAIMFGVAPIMPVGQSGPSTAGASSAELIESYLYEVDARFRFGDCGYVLLTFGQAFVEDTADTFDRDILWFAIEGLWNVTPEFYVVGRYSEVGTYEDDEGFLFSGKTFASLFGLGYDVRRFQRFSLGVGWRPAHNVLVKAEGGFDRVTMVDGSPLDARNDERWYGALEVVVSF